MSEPATKPALRTGDTYLVVARTNLDEIPLALCATREHARMEAAAATEKSIYHIANEVMQVDNAGICCIAIIVFLGGKPIDLEIVREWTEADYTEASAKSARFLDPPPLASGLRPQKAKKKGKKK